MKILLVEDDNTTAAALSEALKTKKYQVDTADNGEMGLEMAKSLDYDLIVLDVMLPKIDGITVCRRLRHRQNQTPILLLTGKNRPNDCIMGLEAGADDYLVKPFDWGELLARIHALLRRGSNLLPEILTWEHLHVNLNTHEVTYKEEFLHLTPTEYGVLSLLLRNPQRIFTRQEILDRVWPFDRISGEETVTTHVKGLRRKLKKIGMNKDIIQTVYGFGYRLREKDNFSEDLTINGKSDIPLTPIQQKVQEKIVDIWIENEEKVKKEVKYLVSLIYDLNSQKSIPEKQQQEAITLAHRLGGTLGTFGKKQESVILRKIEESLREESHPKTLLNLVSLIPDTLLPDPDPVAETAIADDPILLLIGVQNKEVQSLKTAPLPQNFTIETVSTLKKAKLFLKQYQTGLIVIDLDSLPSKEDGLTFLGELRQKEGNLPFIILDTQNDLAYRLKIAELGKGRFLVKPLTGDRLFQALKSLLHFEAVRDIKLMLVDDDPDFLEILTEILAPWGFEVVTLSDPQTFWPVFEQIKPDLLILDVEMPYFNGLNLCKVIRQDDRFYSLPILFISSYSNPEMIAQALRVGGDDYIQKAIVTEELIPRLFKHLLRKR